MARLQKAIAGFAPEEIRKAEELLNWQFIEKRGEIEELRDHLARFPGGSMERNARTKLAELVWTGLGETPTAAGLQGYLQEFPKGADAGAATAKLAALEKAAAEAKAAEERQQRDTEGWAAASTADTEADYQAYLKAWPDGGHAKAARKRERELRRGPMLARFYRGAGIGTGAIIGLAVLVGLIYGAATRQNRALERDQNGAATLPKRAEEWDQNAFYGDWVDANNSGYPRMKINTEAVLVYYTAESGYTCTGVIVAIDTLTAGCQTYTGTIFIKLRLSGRELVGDGPDGNSLRLKKESP